MVQSYFDMRYIDHPIQSQDHLLFNALLKDVDDYSQKDLQIAV